MRRSLRFASSVLSAISLSLIAIALVAVPGGTLGADVTASSFDLWCGYPEFNYDVPPKFTGCSRDLCLKTCVGITDPMTGHVVRCECP